MTAPFTKIPCVYYHSILQEWRRSGKSSSWVTIAEYLSDIPFLVEDDTGAVNVDPVNAQTELPLSYDQRDGDLRYREYLIPLGSPVYVLGTARLKHDWMEMGKTEIERRTKALYSDPEQKAALDTNKDGWIDEQEWETARARIRDEVRKSIETTRQETDGQLQDKVPDHLKEVIVGKGSDETTFIISVYDEETLARSFARRTAMIFVGGALILASLFILLKDLRQMHR